MVNEATNFLPVALGVVAALVTVGCGVWWVRGREARLAREAAYATMMQLARAAQQGGSHCIDTATQLMVQLAGSVNDESLGDGRYEMLVLSSIVPDARGQSVMLVVAVPEGMKVEPGQFDALAEVAEENGTDLGGLMAGILALRESLEASERILGRARVDELLNSVRLKGAADGEAE